VRGGKPPAGDEDDFEGFMDEVRPQASAILARYSVSGDQAFTILAEALAVTYVSEGNRSAHRRQFLGAVEAACQDLRARLGPPEEEDPQDVVH